MFHNNNMKSVQSNEQPTYYELSYFHSMNEAWGWQRHVPFLILSAIHSTYFSYMELQIDSSKFLIYEKFP